MKEVSVAVWGLGPHALKNVLPAISSTAGVSLHGVSSRNREVVASACREYGCATWDTPEAMLEDGEVDAIYLATPIGLHASQGSAVLESGKHLWCEKPMARNSEEVTTLTALSRARGVTAAEGFMYLYHPQFTYLTAVVNSGRLGYLQSVSCRFGIPPLDRPGFRNSPQLGGGAFLDVGCYPISAVTSLFPEGLPEVAFAEIIVEPPAVVDSKGSAVLRYERGVDATLQWRVGSAYRNEIDFWGTDGSLSSERIFSKPAGYVPRFRFLDRQGRETFEWGEGANHFEKMFLAFSALVHDPAAAERERSRIERCARLMDRIREHSRR